MKEVPGFIMYHDQLAPFVENMNNEDFGELMRAVYNYSYHGELYEGNALMKISFDVLKTKVDHDREKYLARCARNAENARARWNKEKEAAAADATQLSDEDDRLLRRAPQIPG